jgi:tetratricopeptide (TPR) repeat protein
LENQGNVREAERLLIRIIRDTQPPGGSSIELAVALNNLGVLYVSLDRYADAEQHFLRALRILKASNEDAAVQLAAKTTLGLASLYNQSGRHKETAKLDIPALVSILRTPEDRARARTALAAVHAYRGDLDAAERLYVETLSFWQSPANGAGDNGIEIGTILNNLAVIAGRGRLIRRLSPASSRTYSRTAPPPLPVSYDGCIL